VKGSEPRRTLIETAPISSRDRYHLLTSLVVPRPIAWISSRSAAGVPNLAPFSYFAAISATPMLVGVSIGSRRGSPKDTLTNIRETGVFCINLVSEAQLAAMNESSAEHPAAVDEFEVAGLRPAEAQLVSAPYVAECPAVLECRLYQEVALPSPQSAFLIAEVLGVRLSEELEPPAGGYLIDPRVLRPVARLGGDLYSLLGEIPSVPRPPSVAG
jgi:flavin reductase (DIM6/NTAB) family NADH-FMN oxidoreductase RutF